MPADSHSRIGGSGAKRWMNCPGSVARSQGIESVGSIFAAEGTAAHSLGETCLLKGSNPHDHIGEVIVVDGHQFEVDLNMADAVKIHVDHCRSLIKKYPDAEYHVEYRMNLEAIHPDMFGTVDFMIYDAESGYLELPDYKHGAGVSVDVEENEQLIYYALGVAIKLPFVKKIRLTIVQPRCYHEDGAVRSFDIEPADMLEWWAVFEEAIELAMQPDAPIAVGDWCRWCPANGVCKELEEYGMEEAKSDFLPVTVDEARDVYSPERLGELMDKIPIIENWCKAIRELAYNLAENKTPIPNHKLVPKKAVRKWVENSADDVMGLLDLQGYDYDEYMVIVEDALKSAPQIEKLVGKKAMKQFDKHVSKISSGHTLVHESDPRPAIKLAAEQEFSKVEDVDDGDSDIDDIFG